MTRRSLAVSRRSAPRWSGSSRRAAQAQKKADWLTDGGDPQRTAWQRNETILNKDNVKDMKLLWKVKLDNQPRQMHSLFPPLIAGNVATADGTKEIAIVAGVSDNIFAIDVDNGHAALEAAFRQHVPGAAATGRGGGTLCPGGLTATPVLDQPSPGKYIAYAVSWDGRLRKLDVATGNEIEPPALFVPPNGKPYALNLVNGVIYTSTAQGCGGNPNNFYSYDLATKKVGNWAPGSGGLWPRTGPVGRQGRHRLRRQRRRRLRPGAADLRTGVHRREAEPGDEGARAEGLVRAVERVLDAQARPRLQHVVADLRLQGQGIHRLGEQGVPHLADGHVSPRRRGSSHARPIARRSSATRK